MVHVCIFYESILDGFRYVFDMKGEMKNDALGGDKF